MGAAFAWLAPILTGLGIGLGLVAALLIAVFMLAIYALYLSGRSDFGL